MKNAPLEKLHHLWLLKTMDLTLIISPVRSPDSYCSSVSSRYLLCNTYMETNIWYTLTIPPSSEVKINALISSSNDMRLLHYPPFYT